MYPNSIREINGLPEAEKVAMYRTLLPEWVFSTYVIDRETLTADGKKVVQFRCPPGSRAMEITVKRRASDIDAVMYLNMADTFNHQLLVLLVVVNDMNSTRYNIDIDHDGNTTHLGTSTRNLEAELAALEAGLSPGQIRAGMRVFKQAVPVFEQFVSNMGHDMFFIEPMAYHNAIVFERYGFNYLRGHKDMLTIHQGFQPDGELYQKLTPDNPFRPVDAWNRVRGRSWAIHDGILGHPFTGFQMYKRIGAHAGVNTFPNAIW
jgi:hypothetical protein